MRSRFPLAAAVLIGAWIAFPEAGDARSLRITTIGTSITKSGGWQLDLKSKLMECGIASKISVVAKGGANSAWGVSKLSDVAATKPDVIVVEFAINDALSDSGVSIEQSRENLSTIADAVRPAKVVFIVTNRASGVRAQVRPQLSDYYLEVRDLARSTGAVLVEPKWSSRAMDGAPDGLHPSHDAAVELLVPPLADAIDPRC